MRKFLIIFAVLAFSALSAVIARAQTEPPTPNLPIESETATSAYDAYEGDDSYAYSTITVTSQEAIDDAETGSEIVVLGALSLLAGIGLFLIKRYFDLKKYSI
ncbi:MAG: hypothetical protein OEV37_02140 [Candidatus Berkelbacteria bacterium]|nr:hypothetical protein [Candidatus Berkelbacteria bacterium]